MDSEKNLLTQDLIKQENPEEIKKFIEDAELLGHEDIAELGRKKLQEILERADNIGKTSETQTAQVESMGGTGEEVSERTKEVDQKIKEIKEAAVKDIKEVKNENITVSQAIEISKNSEISLSEKINLLKKGGSGVSDYFRLAVESSNYSVDEAKELVENGVIDLALFPENKRKEIYSIGELNKKSSDSIDLLMKSQNPDEQFNADALREMVLTFGAIEELNVDYEIEKVDKIAKDGSVNILLKQRAEQVKKVVDHYRQKGLVKRFGDRDL